MRHKRVKHLIDMYGLPEISVSNCAQNIIKSQATVIIVSVPDPFFRDYYNSSLGDSGYNFSTERHVMRKIRSGDETRDYCLHVVTCPTSPPLHATATVHVKLQRWLAVAGLYSILQRVKSRAQTRTAHGAALKSGSQKKEAVYLGYTLSVLIFHIFLYTPPCLAMVICNTFLLGISIVSQLFSYYQ